MNAVKVEPVISDPALQSVDAVEFPVAFLAAFGNKDTALRRLRVGNSNRSALPVGMVQRNTIHVWVCQPGTASAGQVSLRRSQATAKGQAKFNLATDGQALQAEDVAAGEIIACDSPDFPERFGFFLPLAGIYTVNEIKDSRLHPVWVSTVCGKMKTDFRYSNTLGWNTSPVPLLTEQNKADLPRCAENFLLIREARFPATSADLSDPNTMPENLRQAHEHNDVVLEHIYLGRRFDTDTERLGKLFDFYTTMVAKPGTTRHAKAAPAKKAARKAAA